MFVVRCRLSVVSAMDTGQLQTDNYCVATKYLLLKLRNGTQAAKVPMATTAMKIIRRSVQITCTG